MEQQQIDLTGRRILVVEDDYALATELCADLRALGATVLGPAPTSHYAYNLMMGRRGIDSAILDIGLHGRDVYELAETLRSQGVPLVFATGFAEHDILAGFRDEPRFQKPVATADLVEMLDRLMRGRAGEGGAANAPIALQQEARSEESEGDAGLVDRWGRAIARAMRPVRA